MPPLDCWDHGSNPTEGMDVRLLCLCCVVTGLDDRLITRSEEVYFVCVLKCVLSRNLRSETV